MHTEKISVDELEGRSGNTMSWGFLPFLIALVLSLQLLIDKIASETGNYDYYDNPLFIGFFLAVALVFFGLTATSFRRASRLGKNIQSVDRSNGPLIVIASAVAMISLQLFLNEDIRQFALSNSEAKLQFGLSEAALSFNLLINLLKALMFTFAVTVALQGFVTGSVLSNRGTLAKAIMTVCLFVLLGEVPLFLSQSISLFGELIDLLQYGDPYGDNYAASILGRSLFGVLILILQAPALVLIRWYSDSLEVTIGVALAATTIFFISFVMISSTPIILL